MACLTWEGPGYAPLIRTPIWAPLLPFHRAEVASSGFTRRNSSRLWSSSKSMAQNPPECSPSLTATLAFSKPAWYTSRCVASLVSLVYLNIGTLVPEYCGTRNSGSPSQALRRSTVLTAPSLSPAR